MAEINSVILDQYLQALAAIEASQFDRAAEIVRTWRLQIENAIENLSWMEDLRRLISARLALKAGHSQQTIEQLLERPSIQDPFVMAEYHFVRGLFYFQTDQSLKGAEEFDIAASLYLVAKKPEKALLARYNRYVGKINADQLEFLDQYEVLNELEKEALSIHATKALAWILRQKSYLFQAQGRFAAALSFIQEAAQIFKIHGPISDYQLAVLQAADCYLELGKSLEAQGEFEKLLGNIDARVEFARDYILARLEQRELNLNHYSVRPPVWEKKWKSKQQQSSPQFGHWNLSSGELKINSENIKIKLSSKEGSLLRILMQNKRSKSSICEMLWPEQAETLTLDNRLHKLLSRLNKKIELVIYKDGFYSLKIQIRTD